MWPQTDVLADGCDVGFPQSFACEIGTCSLSRAYVMSPRLVYRLKKAIVTLGELRAGGLNVSSIISAICGLFRDLRIPMLFWTRNPKELCKGVSFT